MRVNHTKLILPYIEGKVLTLQIYTKYFMTSARMLFVLYFYAQCSVCLTVSTSNFILETLNVRD